MTRNCTRCTALIPENRVARGSCFCSKNAGESTRSSGAGRRPRNAAGFVAEQAERQRHPWVPPLHRLKFLDPARRAHKLVFPVVNFSTTPSYFDTLVTTSTFPLGTLPVFICEAYHVFYGPSTFNPQIGLGRRATHPWLL